MYQIKRQGGGAFQVWQQQEQSTEAEWAKQGSENCGVSQESGAPTLRARGGQGSPLLGSHRERRASLRFGAGEGQWEMAGRKMNRPRPQRSEHGGPGMEAGTRGAPGVS